MKNMKNIFIYWCMIINSISIIYYYNLSLIYLFYIYISQFTLLEIIYFYFNIPIYDTTEQINRSYDWFDTFIDDKSNIDLTEGYFEDDNIVSYKTSMKQKYDKIFELLDIKPTDNVLDIGCGNGNWIKYLISKNIKVTGITISKVQAKNLQNEGYNVILGDGRNIPKILYNKYDIITYLGCIEHFAKWNDKNRINDIYKNIFTQSKLCFNEFSNQKKMFITVLNCNTNSSVWYNFMTHFKFYFLERHYSGYYPKINQINNNKPSDFIQLYNSNQTEDYRYISIICKNHFGYFTIKWNLYKIIYTISMFLYNPFAFHTWIYHIFSLWIWHIGGNSIEFNRKKTLDSPCILTWEMYQQIKIK
jgi:cyclopropane fatty-acyl-phospholipid synthase-like methyltransferase